MSEAKKWSKGTEGNTIVGTKLKAWKDDNEKESGIDQKRKGEKKKMSK